MWATVVCVYAACFCSFSSAPATENTEVIMHKELLCVEVSETVETVHCNHFVLFAHAFFDLLLPFLFKHSYQPVSILATAFWSKRCWFSGGLHRSVAE